MQSTYGPVARLDVRQVLAASGDHICSGPFGEWRKDLQDGRIHDDAGRRGRLLAKASGSRHYRDRLHQFSQVRLAAL